MQGIVFKNAFYQSHQSGIETRHHDQNRFFSHGYQSHQSGIETGIPVYPCSELSSYQSHQSGIETNGSFLETPIVGVYQSHQSGIETVEIERPESAVISTNRTNLELKPENNDGSLGSFILPIAPIWN